MKNNYNTNYIMAQMPYKKALWKIVLPSIATALVMTAYFTIDRILIARLVSSDAMGSFQYIGSQFQLLSGILFIISAGSKFSLSIAFGEKDIPTQRQILKNSFWLMFILSSLMLVFLILYGTKFPYIMGAPEPLASLGAIYIKVITPAMFFQAFVHLFNAWYTSKGYTKILFIFTLIAQLINIAFDILFMKYFNMGIAGAAWATSISIYLSLIMFVGYSYFVKKEFMINFFKYKPSFSIIKKISQRGIPSSMTNVLLGLKIMTFTYFFTKVAAKEQIIVYTAARTIMGLLMIPAFGIINGSSPLLGYNFGAKNFVRLKDVSRYKLKASTIYLLVTAAIIWIFPRQLLSIFNSGQYDSSVFISRILVLTFWMVSYPIAWGVLFSASGHPKQASTIHIIRSILTFIPIMIIASFFNSWKIMIIALPIQEVIATFVCWIYIKKQLKKPSIAQFVE